MKKQKLLRNLNSKGRYLTLLLTVTAGLLYCSSAWAGYWVIGNAVGGWGTWKEMTCESGSRYTMSLSADQEFKVSCEAGYKDDWYKGLTITTGVGASLARTGDSNTNMKITLNDGYGNPVLCLDPTGYDGKGAIWVEASQAKKVGFFETKDNGYVWQIQFGYNGNNWKQHGDRDANYSGNASLGTLSTDLYIDASDNSYAWTFGAANKQVVLYSQYKVNGGTYSSFKKELSQDWSAEGDQQVKFQSNKKIFSASDATPGNYSYMYYLQVTATDADCDNCHCSYGVSAGSNMEITFTYPGFTTTSTSYNFGDVNLGANDSKTISFTKHYGTALNTSDCDITGDGKLSYSVTNISDTGVEVKFQPTGGLGSKPATLTITDEHGKKCTITLSGNATSSTTPTVLIGAKEQIEAQEVTLYGYVKYTGCKNISKVGFIASQTRSDVESATPTATKYEGTASADPIEAGTDFSYFSDEFENATYYYRAWMEASDGTEVYSDEIRTFTPAGVCNITDAASVLPIFKSGKTTESATFTDSHASIDLSVDKDCIADVYQWNVESQPAGGNATFSPEDKRNTSVTVSAVGTYTFTLSAKCTDGIQLIKSSRVLTLNVCEPALTTQLYLDNHTDNVLCVGEKATATCITKTGYTYSLYSPSGDNLGSLPGTGGTQTWRNVTGAGEFTMRTSPTSMPQCAAVVSSATQRYNEPTMEITAEPALSVLSYQPVTLSKKTGEAETYVDTDPTWVITDGSDKAYLLNEHNRLAYDNRARKSVVFKAGAGVATQITVAASAYKTVEVDDPDPKVENYTKQCPATVDVTLTVSPAVDDCD